MVDFNSEFLSQMKRILNSEFDEFLMSFDKEYEKSIRINIKKFENMQSRELSNFYESYLNYMDEVEWDFSGYYVADKADALSSNPLYSCGLYYFQEASAMAPVNFMPLKKGMKVLDLCAAPGGKTLQISSKIGDSGFLISNDISVSRQRATLRNIERFALQNVLVCAESPQRIAEIFPDYFDAILLDAPCSGEGMFAKDLSLAKEWYKGINEEYAERQYAILNEVYKALKPDGYLMYSTCTFSDIENEKVLDRFIKEHQEFAMIEIDDGGKFSNSVGDLPYAKRIWPHKQRGLGHFMGLMKRLNTEEDTYLDRFDCYFDNKKNFKATKELESAINLFLDFCNECDIYLPNVLAEFPTSGGIEYKFRLYNDKLHYISNHDVDDEKFRILRNGLLLGGISHGKFVPSQAFAMVLSPLDIYKKIDLSTRKENHMYHINKYLKGETLEIRSGNGYVLLFIDNLPIGWVTSDGLKLKNKFKKDWIL